MLKGFNIEKLSETKETYNVLIYGNSGVGKTRLAATASDILGKTLFVDAEGGTYTIRNMYPDMDVIRITDFSGVQKLYDALFDGGHDYSTIIVDSLTELQKMDMNLIMRKAALDNPKMIEEVPSMREYGISLEHMRKLVRAFRDLPYNVIFTCLADSGRDQNTGKTYGRPMLTGKFALEVQAFFDEVFYLFVKEYSDKKTGELTTERVLLTGTTNNFEAKDRSGLLPLTMTDPTMTKIVTAMKGANK